LPAVLALHDHGGNKYFGTRKIAQMGDTLHPMMKEHRDRYYGGVSWANELARRGYAVLVHDAFPFASRRVRAADLAPSIRRDLKEVDPESMEEIRAYNRFAGEHESLMAKSLFCAGTTWPGVFVAEDRRALDYLESRPDVDPKRLGCAGLSGGGMRTVYLGGIDDRIACACCVGMMTTWRDYLLHKCYTHTWMIYIPGLPLDLDYPEILGLRVPKPTLVLNDDEDDLFTIGEMKRADRIMAEVFAKAGAGDRYHCSFYPGKHKFDRPMQAEAFDWFDRWLKA
jgi:dienelactone hydrolase